MKSTTLGRLIRVEMRDIWLSGSSDFTPWLAREENLAVLGETLGLGLELEAQEKSVGPWSEVDAELIAHRDEVLGRFAP